MKIKNKFGSKNMTAKAGRSISYIVVHYTAGVTSRAGSAENTASWFDSGSAPASSDFIVDDSEVVQYNSDIENRYTWHCGGTYYPDHKGGKFYKKCTNANAIGIEVCSVNSTGKMTSPNDRRYSFTDSAVKNTAELVKFLMEKYSIPAENVIRHYDVTGKLCPGIYGWNAESGSEAEWKKFKADVSGGKIPEKTPKYYVQAGAFSDIKNAEAFLEMVKINYPEAFIKVF